MLHRTKENNTAVGEGEPQIARLSTGSLSKRISRLSGIFFTDISEIVNNNHSDNDEDESQFSTASTNNEDDNHQGAGDEQRLMIAKNETKAIFFMRGFVILVLLVATVTVSTCVYFYTRAQEQSSFETTFQSYSKQIITTVHVNAQQKLEAVGAIALQIQAYAINQKLSWPFVTMPFFEETVLATKSLTDAYGVYFFPIIYEETRKEWEIYSVKHRHWINESYATQRELYGIDGLTAEVGEDALSQQPLDWFDILWGWNEKNYDPRNPDFSSGISSSIFKTRWPEEDPDKRSPGIEDGPGPYFPQWQVAEMGWYYQTTVNLNYGRYSDFLESTRIVNETQTAVYGEAWDDSNVPGYITTMLYPIFDTFNQTEAKVVGFLAADLLWIEYIRRILPPATAKPIKEKEVVAVADDETEALDDTASDSDVGGIYVVIDSTCDQTFTYEIYGSDVKFIDDGDVHEIEYDTMVQSFLFGEELMEPMPSQSTYTGRPLSNEFCAYTFHIYPSKEMENLFLTSKPITYSMVAAFIFLFTSFVFICYDWLVERRQKIVLNSANRAEDLVSSLFPEAVKAQLYNQADENNKNNSNGKQKLTNNSSNRSVLDDGDEGIESLQEMGIQNPKNTNKNGGLIPPEINPIAELYPETTVLFADIVGFTGWSSNRKPTDVFLLLETIYGKFDSIAKRRCVFKVETIGDCYVAATGLPRPQEFHALIMARFAIDCLTCMPEELIKLSDKLGESTSTLAMRVGMHSGPVTAGVLRGEKARFQLFGDTMNTAARMESNGEKNRIHVSETTANLLSKAGKEKWIKKRQDKIVAKGKGEMQTYWVEVVVGSRRGSGGFRSPGRRGSNDVGDDGDIDNSNIKS